MTGPRVTPVDIYRVAAANLLSWDGEFADAAVTLAAPGGATMIEKRVLVPERLRRPPATGWSWIDRRFLREHGDSLSREALLLYLFWVAVADRHGLSFYSDHALTCRLRLTQPALEQARQELLQRDLIARQLPLVQVLSLPTAAIQRRAEPGQGLIVLGELLRQAAAGKGSKPS
jgi:hypothetical protein